MSHIPSSTSYEQYLGLRGYDPSAGKLLILRRALIESWAQPGFHRFWQVWNPGIGHLLFRLYLRLGGNRVRWLGTLLVFTLCGLCHDAAVMLVFRRPFLAFTTAFALFGILTLISRLLEPVLLQERWPRVANVFVNALLVAMPIYASVQLQMFSFP